MFNPYAMTKMAHILTDMYIECSGVFFALVCGAAIVLSRIL